MRIRTVKPEFWRHAVMAQLPPATQLLALAILNMADDEGYFEADPRIVRGEVMPFREDLRSLSGDLRELHRIGWVELRNTPGHGPVGWIVNWAKHQRVSHPAKSKLRVYFDASGPLEDLASGSGAAPEDVRREGEGEGEGEQGTGKGNREQGGAAAAVTKKPKKPKAQAELPQIIPPAPPREPSRGEVLFRMFLDAREDHLSDVLEVEPSPDAVYGVAWLNKVFRGWFDLWADVPFSEKWTQVGLATGAEVRCIQLFNAYFELDWPAKCVARVDGKDTGTPQPYPFSALASSKVWLELVAKLWPDEQPQVGAA